MWQDEFSGWWELDTLCTHPGDLAAWGDHVFDGIHGPGHKVMEKVYYVFWFVYWVDEERERDPNVQMYIQAIRRLWIRKHLMHAELGVKHGRVLQWTAGRQTPTGRITRVVDGDTMEAMDSGGISWMYFSTVCSIPFNPAFDNS